MKLKKGDNVIEVPDMGVCTGVIYKPHDWIDGYKLVLLKREIFDALDRGLKGPPTYACAFPHCVTVWPPMDRDGEIIVRYYPPEKEL